MSVHLGPLYSSIVAKLEKERDQISEDDFESGSPKPAFYVLFLHSAAENFFGIAFKKLLQAKIVEADAKECLEGKLSNFSLNNDFSLFCSLFLPEIYQKSEIRKKFIHKRNAYAHRIIDKSGRYAFLDDEYSLSKEDIDEYFDHFQKLMKDIAEAADSPNSRICGDGVKRR